MFRPDRNMARMHSSAVRSALPEFDQVHFCTVQGHLIHFRKKCKNASKNSLIWSETGFPTPKLHRSTFDQQWSALSPLLVFLYVYGVNLHNCKNNVKPPKFAKCFVILCPVGPYFATGGFNPVSLVADPSVVRAWDGGSGNFKMGANYAPTIHPHMEVR